MIITEELIRFQNNYTSRKPLRPGQPMRRFTRNLDGTYVNPEIQAAWVEYQRKQAAKRP